MEAAHSSKFDEGDESEVKTEEQKQIQRLSDDDNNDSQGEGRNAENEITFKDFLVVCQTKGEARPEVFRYQSNTGGVNWQDKLTVKGQ